MGIGTRYQIIFLLHLTCVIVGFGSSFVYPVLAAKAKGLSPKEAFAINHASFSISRYLTTYPIYAAGFFGLCLVLSPINDDQWTFKQTWVSLAMLMFILGVAVEVFLHTPNLKALDGLGAKLADQDPVKAAPAKQIAEMEERRQKAAMYGGVLHLLWALLMLDMVFKPFYSTFSN